MKLRRQPAVKLALAQKRKAIALRLPLHVRKQRALSRSLSACGAPVGDVRASMGIISPGTKVEVAGWPQL